MEQNAFQVYSEARGFWTNKWAHNKLYVLTFTVSTYSLESNHNIFC